MISQQVSFEGSDVTPKLCRGRKLGAQVQLVGTDSHTVYLYAPASDLRRIADQLLAIANEVEAEQ